MKWGDRLELTAEAGPGDFIYGLHSCRTRKSMQRRPTAFVRLVRSGQEPVVVNLDIPAVEPNPEQVHWVDNIHPPPKR